MEKDHLSIKKANQRLKLWAHVPIAVSLCPVAAHTYRGTFRN